MLIFPNTSKVQMRKTLKRIGKYLSTKKLLMNCILCFSNSVCKWYLLLVMQLFNSVVDCKGKLDPSLDHYSRNVLNLLIVLVAKGSTQKYNRKPILQFTDCKSLLLLACHHYIYIRVFQECYLRVRDVQKRKLNSQRSLKVQCSAEYHENGR